MTDERMAEIRKYAMQYPTHLAAVKANIIVNDLLDEVDKQAAEIERLAFTLANERQPFGYEHGGQTILVERDQCISEECRKR